MSVFGVALRMLGHGKKSVIIQFMKGRKDIGEYKIQGKLGSKYKVYQFGRKEFFDTRNPSAQDKALAQEGLEFAKKLIQKNSPDLLVLDEISLADYIKLIDIDDVIQLINSIPKKTITYITGRMTPKK